ncbi:malonyl CoA-acyl carrier protein transacylase, partial [Actinobacillus pleuropneumoniae]|nr:malonyl CoA-acyl carrier protein transacylase [Actinobacillus pleuropneumoniae]
VTTLYEIGPGKVLTGLTSRIVKELKAQAVNDLVSLEAVSA